MVIISRGTSIRTARETRRSEISNGRTDMQVLVRADRARTLTKVFPFAGAVFRSPIAHHAVRHRSGKSLKRRSKVTSTSPTGNFEGRINPEFVDIVERSQEKLHNRLSGGFPDIKLNSISQQSISDESTKPIKTGDLIWNGNTVNMVIYVPLKYNDHVLTMNMRGIVSEISWQQIRTRLGAALPNEDLNIPLADLVVDEPTEIEAVLDSVQSEKPFDPVRSPELAAQEKSYSDLRIVGKAVQSSTYLAFAHQLREFQLEIEATVDKWIHATSDYVKNELQQTNHAVIVPLIDFADAVRQRIPGHQKSRGPLSSLEYCAIQICLEDDSLLFDVRKSVSCLSTDSLTVYPSCLSNKLLETQYDSGISTEYLKHYACGELINPVSESTAIAELRRRFPTAGKLDPSEAVELLRLPDGGMWDKTSYGWLYHTASTNRLNPQQLLPDKIASIREEYHHPVYCIDSKNAKVAEDGISLEKTESPHKFRIGIHVSNPSAFMDLGGRSFLQNLPLAGTILEKDHIWRMLPYNFTSALSLNAKNRPSLSVFAQVDIETGEVTDRVIKPLTLTNVQNFTVDELHSERSVFDTFWKIAKWRVHTRFNRGAFHIDNYEDVLLQNNDLPAEVHELPLVGTKISLSHTLVEEFMLFANELVGEFCKLHNIPILYRTRDMLLPSKSIIQEFESERVANRGLVGAQWRKVVSGTRLSTSPGDFAGSGVSVYTRFTSPLRRLEDLLVHHQIQGFLTRDLAVPASQYSLNDLNNIKNQLEVRQLVVQSLIRDVSYLKKFQKAAVQPGMKVLGVVVKNMEENALASIYLPALELYVDYQGRHTLPIGHTREFTVTRIMRFARTIKVE